MTAARKKAAPSASTRKRVNALIRAVAKNPEGAALIALARREKIRIVISDKPRAVGATGLFHEDDKAIDLDRKAKDKELAEVLAHELRHLWQSRIIRLDTNGLSAVNSMVQRRITECDAFAYQIRFQLTSGRDDLAEIKKSLTKAPDKKKAAASLKEFNALSAMIDMKAFFMSMQSEMDCYDRQTIETLQHKLEIARIFVKYRELLENTPSKAKKWEAERSKNDRRLKELYNEIAHPRPLDKKLPEILREGLASDSRKYFRYQNVDNLAAFIRREIPKKTLKKAQALEKKILTVIEKSGAAPVRRQNKRQAG